MAATEDAFTHIRRANEDEIKEDREKNVMMNSQNASEVETYNKSTIQFFENFKLLYLFVTIQGFGSYR